MNAINIDETYLYHEYVTLERSSYEIAKDLGCGSTTVITYLRKYNIPRRNRAQPKITVVFEGIEYHRYPESKSFTNQNYFTGSINGETVRLHRKIYEHAYGNVPDGFDVHHVDGNPLNNELSNLALVRINDHHAHHTKILRPRIEKGIRSFWDKREYREVKCPQCGKVYRTRATKDVKFCSSNCWNKAHYELK